MRTYKIRLLKCSGKDQKISAYLQLLTGLDKVMANRIVSNLQPHCLIIWTKKAWNILKRRLIFMK